jgi:hypothetical protein
LLGGGITKSLNISQNGIPKINMVEIGGYVFEIDRAARYSTDNLDDVISIHCTLQVNYINQGSNIENISIYGVSPFDINWSHITYCEVQCLTADEEDFRTTIVADGTNIYYRSDSDGVIEAIMDNSETSHCNANIATAVMNRNGTVKIIFDTPEKGFKVTIQIK